MAIRFRLSDAARGFFGSIRKQDELSTDFDIYYLCLMAGLLSGRKGDCSDATEFVDYFPERYKERSKLIVGTFVATELEKSGVPYTEKKRVHEEIRKLVDPQSNTHLSAEGVHQMNRFVAGGLEYLKEEFDERPRALDEFVLMYGALFS